MLHIAFALYVLSLLSGVLLLSALGSNPKFRFASGFSEFFRLYLIITAFVCITAVCLYLSFNVSESNELRQLIFNVYFMVILLFLGALPVAIEKYNSTIYRFSSPAWFKGLLRAGVLYAAIGAVAVWRLAESWYVLIVGCSIGLLIVALVIISWRARRYYGDVFKGCKAKWVSRAMIAQSLGLPAVEVVFWSEHLSRDGFTFSLPLLYLVNNLLLWRYRDQLMPVAGIAVPLRDTESLLSPKEREIAGALAQGLSNKAIAARLGIAQSTVKNHIYNIFKKCNVTNRIALITYLRAE